MYSNGTSPSTSTANVEKKTPLNLKKLTVEEMVARKAKGMCFNCDEQFSPRHRCKKLFSFEVEQDDEIT